MQLLLMPFLPSLECMTLRMPKLPKLLKCTTTYFVSKILLMLLIVKKVFQEFCTAGIREMAMLEVTHGNYCQLY